MNILIMFNFLLIGSCYSASGEHFDILPHVPCTEQDPADQLQQRLWLSMSQVRTRETR